MLQIESYHQIKFTIHSRYWKQIFEDRKAWNDLVW